MTSQIIKHNFPPELLYDFLETNADKNKIKTTYIFDNACFKKAKYNNNICSFLDECKLYYYTSKHKYLNDPNMKYVKFLTIIRQICNYLNIEYISNVKYIKSSYEIIYYITI